MSKAEAGVIDVGRRDFLKGAGAAIVLGVAGIPIFTSCTENKSAKVTNFRSDEMQVTMDIPSDWYVYTKKEDYNIPAFKTHLYIPVSKYSSVIIDSVENSGFSLDEYARESSTDYSYLDKEKWFTVKTVKDLGEYIVDGYRAVKVHTKITEDDGGKVKKRETSYVLKDRANTLWNIFFGSSSEEEYNREFPKFEKMVKSFHILRK